MLMRKYNASLIENKKMVAYISMTTVGNAVSHRITIC